MLMKNNKIGILLVLMLFVGVCGLLYPSVSQYWNTKTQTRAVENYREILDSLKPEDYEAYFQEAEKYNTELSELSAPLLDYSNLLALTGYITQRPSDVEEMYRRMVFNYLTDNKDDHCKNFSYTIHKNDGGKWYWHLAPAYDLTHCTEGYNGQHATSVNGTGKPTLQDFISVGTKIKIPEKRCREIFQNVYDNCADLLCYRL